MEDIRAPDQEKMETEGRWGPEDVDVFGKLSVRDLPAPEGEQMQLWKTRGLGPDGQKIRPANGKCRLPGGLQPETGNPYLALSGPLVMMISLPTLVSKWR